MKTYKIWTFNATLMTDFSRYLENKVFASVDEAKRAIEDFDKIEDKVCPISCKNRKRWGAYFEISEYKNGIWNGIAAEQL